jgi:hypothetical protein
MLEWLRALDVFDKHSEEEYKARTVVGTILSMLIFATIIFLSGSGVSEMLRPHLSRDLVVSNQLTSQLPVNISLSVRVAFPCSLLSLTQQDYLGFSQIFSNTVSLRRYDRDGTFLGKEDVHRCLWTWAAWNVGFAR